jgi:hypothetical protein
MGLCGSGEESEVFTSGHSGGFFMLYLGGGAREVCLIPFPVRRIILCLRPHPKLIPIPAKGFLNVGG